MTILSLSISTPRPQNKLHQERTIAAHHPFPILRERVTSLGISPRLLPTRDQNAPMRDPHHLSMRRREAAPTDVTAQQRRRTSIKSGEIVTGTEEGTGAVARSPERVDRHRAHPHHDRDHDRDHGQTSRGAAAGLQMFLLQRTGGAEANPRSRAEESPSQNPGTRQVYGMSTCSIYLYDCDAVTEIYIKYI